MHLISTSQNQSIKNKGIMTSRKINLTNPYAQAIIILYNKVTPIIQIQIH